MSQSKSMLKKVVVIGGGNGSAVCLVALKKYLELFDLSAVISMSDGGGSSGFLRRKFNALPPGDIMRAILSLSKYDYQLLKQIFYKNRFSDGKLKNHNLGNLFLTLSANYSGDFIKAVQALEESVEAVGHAFPATTYKTHLYVELDNGDIINGEAAIDRPKYDRKLKIKKAWLNPPGRIYSGAKKVIEEADYIIFAPGSFYTSLIACLLPRGVKEAIGRSRAKLIYISGNAYETIGETGPEKLSDFINQLKSYLPRDPDLIIYNNHRLTEDEKVHYKEKNWATYEIDKDKLIGYNIVEVDYERKGGGLCSEKLGEVLRDMMIEKNLYTNLKL